MNKENLTSKQYSMMIASLSGMDIINCYHTQDSMIRLELKNKQRHITLIIDGDWQLLNEKKGITNTSEVRLDETDHDYYQRLRQIAKSIKSSCDSVSLSSVLKNGEEAMVSFNNNWILKVTRSKLGLLSYKDETHSVYLICSFDENSSKFKYYTEKLTK
jgi:hypothetical protein